MHAAQLYVAKMGKLTAEDLRPIDWTLSRASILRFSAGCVSCSQQLSLPHVPARRHGRPAYEHRRLRDLFPHRCVILLACAHFPLPRILTPSRPPLHALDRRLAHPLEVA